MNRRAFLGHHVGREPALRFWVALGYNHITRIAGDKKSAETAYADVELTKNLEKTA